MKTIKRLLLTGMATAVVVLAVPALASAAVWTDEETEITTFTSMALTGGELFETSEGNGMNCGLKATLTTEGESTGRITTFDITECPKGFGTFGECELKSAEATGLPWTVHVNATDLTVTGWRVTRTFEAGCPISELDKTIASMTVEFDDPEAFSTMEFEGTTTGYSTLGSLSVSEANEGTWGIG